MFIAYEIKKNAMLRFMKKQAKVDQTINERQRDLIEKLSMKKLRRQTRLMKRVIKTYIDLKEKAWGVQAFLFRA